MKLHHLFLIDRDRGTLPLCYRESAPARFHSNVARDRRLARKRRNIRVRVPKR